MAGSVPSRHSSRKAKIVVSGRSKVGSGLRSCDSHFSAQLEDPPAENRKIFAFVRQYEDERILVVANLSRFVQGVELDLSRFQGMRPVEIFGRVDMPLIGEHPYFLTMGPHSFYWFSLERQRAQVITVEEAEPPPFALRQNWEELLKADEREAIEAALPAFLARQRWFSGKARSLRGLKAVRSVAASCCPCARNNILPSVGFCS